MERKRRPNACRRSDKDTFVCLVLRRMSWGVKVEITKNGRFLTVHSKAEIFRRGSVRIKASGL